MKQLQEIGKVYLKKSIFLATTAALRMEKWTIPSREGSRSSDLRVLGNKVDFFAFLAILHQQMPQAREKSR